MFLPIVKWPKIFWASAQRKRRWHTLVGLSAFAAALGVAYSVHQPDPPQSWSDAELRAIGSLWIGTLPPLPKDPTNAVADHPLAQRLGHRLFFDARLSANGAVSCATCHKPERRFTDGLARAVGLGLGNFNTPSLVGAAYSPWQFWNGRADSLWAQAASPLENPLEHGGSRAAIARLIAADPAYARLYRNLFGPLPELPSSELANAAEQQAATEVFVSAAKALAAYERLLLPGETRFDRYAANLLAGDFPAPPANGIETLPSDHLNRVEVEGLRLFIGQAQCMNCHNGPLFTNHEFHNTGVLPAPDALPDLGRVVGAELVRSDPLNCLGRHNVGTTKDCAELRFLRTGEDLIGARKTPSLRNLQGTAPYMHAGQLRNLGEVLDHYNRAPNAIVGHNEAKPLRLLPYQLKRLEAFLRSLDAPPATAHKWLLPP